MRSALAVGFGTVQQRVLQVWRHLATRQAAIALPDRFGELLAGEAATRFRMLAPHDQAHLVAVATTLGEQGANHNLVVAGLLHDIGKAVPDTRIRVADRIAKVVVTRFLPSLARRFAARTEPPRIGRGLWVLLRHPATGARIAAESGYNDDVQWLIANHERIDRDDPRIQALIDADNRCA